MSSRKILVLAIALPTLAATVYSFKHSGKTCGGQYANVKEYQCPRLYECVLESNKPNATGVCRFLPNGLRLGKQTPRGNEVVAVPPPKDPTVEYDVQTKKTQRLTLAHNKFGFDLIKNLAYSDGTNSQNIVISPTSLSLALNLVYQGSNGATKDQMTNVLQLAGFSLFQLNESSRLLLDRLNTSVTGVTSNLSNSIWIRNGITLNEALLKDAQAYYGAQVTNLDFSQAESSKTINDWVYGNTAGKITNMVPERIDPLTVSYLLNTAYFNGVWKYKFDRENITDRDFYQQNGSKSPVKSMVMERKDFLYLENDTFQAVKLPYGPDEKYSMMVILPKDLEVDNLLGKFDILNWQTWLGGFEKKEGILYLPKFKLDYGDSLVNALKDLGLTIPFSPGEADFSKWSADGLSKDFYISNVLHKTYIDVNEEGTEAAGAAAIEINTDMAIPKEEKEQPFVMDVNKPFFFAIIHNETQANLFVGIVREL